MYKHVVKLKKQNVAFTRKTGCRINICEQIYNETGVLYKILYQVHNYFLDLVSLSHRTKKRHHVMIHTSPLIRTQSSCPEVTAGFPNSQLVKLTVDWSVQSNRPSVFLSLSPIQSSSVDATNRKISTH